jgi:tetratricopeptide (TPR) repeat protein
VSLFNLNKFDEAAITFESLVQKYPDDPLAATAAENIPLAYAKVGKTADSEKALEALLGRTTDPGKKAQLMLQLAQIKEQNGVAADAIAYYQKVDPSRPEYSQAMYGVGNLYNKAGQSDQERGAYEKLQNFQPKDDAYRIAALARLAEIYISQGQAQKALSTYKDVAANAKDATALANAKSRIEELQKVLAN